MTKVSMIIPTYNRPNYLQRILNYYSGYKINYKIIIADSSSQENKEQNKKNIKHFPDLDISYRAYPTEIKPNRKIFYALNRVKSRYCLICADDDFIVPSAIEECFDFMEENPDYAVVLGLYGSHFLKKRKRGKIEFDWQPSDYPSKSLTFDNPCQRLKFHLANYHLNTFYSLHRTDTLRFIFKEVTEVTSYARLAEILLTALTLICGKMKILPIFYASRWSEGSPIEENYNSQPYFSPFWSSFLASDSYKTEYKRAVACLARNLQKKVNLESALSAKVAEDALNGFLDSLRQPPLQRIRGRLSSLLAKTLPGAHLRKIRLRGVKREYADFLEKNDSRFHQNLNRIREIVMASHKTIK